MSNSIQVVIVDDDLDNHRLTKEDFTSIDWIEEIILLRKSSEVFQYLNNLTDPANNPKLIIIDYQLREVNGEELLQQLKAHPKYKHIQVAFYSSNLDRYIRERLNKLGIHYFERPITELQGRELAVEIKAMAQRNGMILFQ